jgi:uncharacterized Zn finger protein
MLYNEECDELGHVWTWMPNETSACMRCGQVTREKIYQEEFGCSIPISFNTSSGKKRMEPGKMYDKDLNEIKEEGEKCETKIETKNDPDLDKLLKVFNRLE